MEIKTVGIVGAGQMGSGIALVAARGGFQAIMHDIRGDLVQRGLQAINKFLDKEISRGTLPASDKNIILGRLKTTTVLDDFQAADFVIEAASENESIKFQVFGDLDGICAPSVILSTNTSSIPVGRIAARTSRPDRVIGMHFMNPAPTIKLVEVIRSFTTSGETYEATCALCRRFDKTPVESGDFPGFISNRILMTMINEAICALQDGAGTREAIDTVMQLGMNHPMGPLTLADLIGLDTCLSIMEILFNGYKDPKYRPCPLLRQYVDAGWLGRKTGRGFYTYSDRIQDHG
jgi:3-hydroxybutyryl-CoA dehydrogenase